MIITEKLEGGKVRHYSDLNFALVDEQGFLYEEYIANEGDTVMLEETGQTIDTTPMRYSVRSIIRELKAIGKFVAVRQMLEAANYDWDFIGSNYLSDDDADFQTMLAAIVSQGILTQAELDTLLPKCIWSEV